MNKVFRILAPVILLITVLVVFWFFRKPKPKCDCYYPNTGEYGIKDVKYGCKVADCEPPK